ncbi:MAG: four helix bundle protein [Anaerolineae bacterium]|nr:four helix bundle protein [Anaerolineae bacterium]
MTNSSGRSEGTRGFEDLICWQLAWRLMHECHALAATFPAIERYDLTLQIRKSTKSGMSNISEGYGRYHYLDSLRFYYIARGSINESINHIITARDLDYMDQPRFQELYELGREAERSLNGFISYVRRQRLGSKEFGDRFVTESLNMDSVPDTDKAS